MKQHLPLNEKRGNLRVRSGNFVGGRLSWVLGVAVVSMFGAAAVADQKAWPMWGRTPQRNMANPYAKNIPTRWDVNTKTNIKWIARVGSRCYGNPVVADGKVFVGTNNAYPRPDGGRG